MLKDILTPQKALFADGVQTVMRGHENRSRRVVLLKGNLVQNTKSQSRGISARVTKNGRNGFSSIASYTEEDAEKVLGFKPGSTDVTKGDLELAGYVGIFRRMIDTFGFKYVVSSLRESFSASDNGWSACIYSRDTKEFYHSKEYSIRPIVDRVGGGDSFAGGVICGLVDGKNFKDALEYGVAASALKHTIPGDFNLVSRKEVETLAGGDASGRVQR